MTITNQHVPDTDDATMSEPSRRSGYDPNRSGNTPDNIRNARRVIPALAASPSLADGRGAVEIVDRLGVPAVRAALLRDRHERALPVPRGPRPASRSNPALLTGRELEVLRLLADGLSNGDIAQRLFLSEKTVGHHVSAVLHKLGEPTRSRAVAAALRRGLVAPR